MSQKTKEKQSIGKDDVGDFPPKDNAIALLKPPTSLLAPLPMSDAEKAFMEESGEVPSGPTKLPAITINHREGVFIMPDGSTIDGQDGLTGFILAHFTTRSYYEKAYDSKAEKVPPDCRSSDCITPDADSPAIQSPSCMTCKHNVFGSAKVGKGKACREFIRLFMVNPEFGNPPLAVVTLPPTALGKFYGGKVVIGGKAGYLDQVKARHKIFQIVWNKLTLHRENDGDVHVMVDFEMGDVATQAVSLELGKLHKQFLDAIKLARREPVEEKS